MLKGFLYICLQMPNKRGNRNLPSVMKNTLAALLLLFSFLANAQDFRAYQFYNRQSKKVNPEKMIRELAQYDVVLFGEHHNNSINHWLQLRLTKALFAEKKGKIMLGAEMFERDNQRGLDAYLAGKTNPKNLKDSVRLWQNYETDYRPLLDFAKTEKLRFIATNIPRTYASQVAKQGLASLNDLPGSEQLLIAQLPIEVTLETPGYKEMKSLMGDHVPKTKLMNFIAAQAVKDATMAESILKNRQPGTLFIHYNGDYHSKQYGGIYWYLKKKNPHLKIAVISVFETDDAQLEVPKKDFYPTEFNLVMPADMIKTYP